MRIKKYVKNFSEILEILDDDSTMTVSFYREGEVLKTEIEISDKIDLNSLISINRDISDKKVFYYKLIKPLEIGSIVKNIFSKVKLDLVYKDTRKVFLKNHIYDFDSTLSKIREDLSNYNFYLSSDNFFEDI